MPRAEQIPDGGLCQCGCGQPTKPAARNRREIGWVKGRPTPYLLGHNGRTGPFCLDVFLPNFTRDGDCLRWRGGHHTSGNGYVRHLGRRVYTHVLVYEIFNGMVPDGRRTAA